MKYKTNSIIFLFLFFAVNVMGQVLPENIKIASVEQQKTFVACRLQAPSPFYVGAQPYVLQIGNSQFDLSRQEDVDSIHTLVFMIPLAEYKALPATAPAYLSYGAMPEAPQIAINLASPNEHVGKKLHYLGVFTKPATIK